MIMGSGVLNLENIVADKVRALCTKNPDYENMLREILKADKICEGVKIIIDPTPTHSEQGDKTKEV